MWSLTILHNERNDEFQDVTDDRGIYTRLRLTRIPGKQAPTSSHLFQLILPLGKLSISRVDGNQNARLDLGLMARQVPHRYCRRSFCSIHHNPLSHADRVIVESLRNKPALVCRMCRFTCIKAISMV